MVSVKEALSTAVETLKAKAAYPARDAASLLSWVLGKGPEYPYVHPDDFLQPSQYGRFLELIQRRAEGEPIAYIKGQKEFMGFDFKVDKRALIPRPETEILVEAAVQILEKRKNKDGPVPLEIADIGCGSGAIGLSIIKILPNVKGVLTDISPKALSLSRENAQRLGVQDRAVFLEGDLFEPIRRSGALKTSEEQGKDTHRVFDLIVSNPPYVSEYDYSRLDEEILKYEPKNALLAGEYGLDVLERLIDQAPFYLKDFGHLLVEIGYNQSEAVSRLFAGKDSKSSAKWHRFWSIRDYAGRERVFIGQFSSRQKAGTLKSF